MTQENIIQKLLMTQEDRIPQLLMTKDLVTLMAWDGSSLMLVISRRQRPKEITLALLMTQEDKASIANDPGS